MTHLRVQNKNLNRFITKSTQQVVNIGIDLKLIELKALPLVRIELTTPGLRDQCSTTELNRLIVINKINFKIVKLKVCLL